MSNAAITPPMRVHGWNVHLLAGPDEFHFAGLYQTLNSELITFRNVVDELRLCFDIPRFERDHDPWDNIAFAPADSSLDLKTDTPSLIQGDDMRLPVPSLPPRNPKVQSIVRFHVIFHKPCEIPHEDPIEAHLKAQCAQHIARPIRRTDPRYLPPKKPSSDPRYAIMPFRRSPKAHTASQSPKRRSGSSSPTKENELEDISGIYTPPKMEVLPEDARKTVESFRRNCLINADSCAVSGEGQSWCISPVVGPALQACHIIPQQHYHLYPDHLYQGLTDDDDDDDVEFSAERLKQAWINTWSNRNGILLMSHLHELFDARLFSIHPDTHQIRAFVPYDVITKFNGQKADLPAIIDRKALRHHYEMSCIENMAAQMPLITLDSPNISSKTTPGIKTPLSRRVDLQMGNVVSRGGDPSKRARSDQDTITQQDGQRDDVQEPLSPDTDIERNRKRRRVDDLDEKGRQRVMGHHNALPDHAQGEGAHDAMVEFLADVNWELRKFKAN